MRHTRPDDVLMCPYSVYDERAVVVKIYSKREDRPLAMWEKKFLELRAALEPAFSTCVHRVT
jgi:hypothetical protein